MIFTWQSIKVIHWGRKESPSRLQSSQRTQTMMDPLYLKILLWYKTNQTHSIKHFCKHVFAVLNLTF